MTCDLRENAGYCLGVRNSSVLFTNEYILIWLIVLQIIACPRRGGFGRDAGSGRGVGHPRRVLMEPEGPDRFQQLQDQLTALAGLVQLLVRQLKCPKEPFCQLKSPKEPLIRQLPPCHLW